jgi:hypothetical protein
MKTYKVIVDEYKTIRWYNEKGEKHCEHGPAVEFADGTKYWYQNGKSHRLDGPAIDNGTKYWYQNGQRHRLDGPAIEWADGEKWWYIEGKEYTEAQFNAYIAKHNASCDGKVVEIEGKRYKLQELK